MPINYKRHPKNDKIGRGPTKGKINEDNKQMTNI